MTEFSAYLLYPIMAGILIYMWKQVRGMTLEEIVHKSAKLHHELIALFEAHPRGGDWPQFLKWQNDQTESDTPTHKT